MEALPRFGYHRGSKEKEASPMSLLEVDGVQKIYTTRFGGAQVQALSHVTFSVEEGE